MTRTAVVAVLVAGCASFSDAGPDFSDQPTLTPTIATVRPPEGAPDQASSPAGGSSQDPTAAPPGGPGAPEACALPELPVVAVCLDEPWGLAPLPDGESAIVGERTSGRMLRVMPQRVPEVVATIDGLDSSAGGGLLGIALSPFYAEDQLIYAYVTTPRDARVLRLTASGTPKAIVTGLPAAGARPGGVIAFGDDELLYVVDAQGRILRYDTFGAAARDNVSGTAVFATGLAGPTGICPLPGGGIGVMDHRESGDVLIVIAEGGDYRDLGSGQALWTFAPGDGGALDCAISDSALLATARTDPALTRIEMRGPDSFTGVPEALLDGDFGMMRTVVTGPGDLVWLTTRNLATDLEVGSGVDPDPSDDRVFVLPPGGGGGGDGGID